MSQIKVGWNVDYLKFRTDFIDLMLKYSVQYKILGHCKHCKGTDRMTSQQPPTLNKKGGGGCIRTNVAVYMAGSFEAYETKNYY
jgi:hypothetical protein